MTSRGDKALTPKFSLPLVGLGTCYYEFVKLKGYYEELDMKSPLYLAGVTNCVVGALGRGDLKLFDRILKDLRR